MRTAMVLFVVFASLAAALSVAEGRRPSHLQAHLQRRHAALHHDAHDIQLLAQTDEGSNDSPASDVPPAAAAASAPAVAAPVTASVSAPVAPVPVAAPAQAQPQEQLLSCQSVSGKTICLPVDSNPRQLQLTPPSAPAVTTPATTAPQAIAAPVAAIPAVGFQPVAIPESILSAQPKVQEPPANAMNSAAQAGVVKALQEKIAYEEAAKTNAVEMAKEMVQTVREETKKIVAEAEHTAQLEREENEKLRAEIVRLQEKLQEATHPVAVAPVVQPTVVASGESTHVAATPNVPTPVEEMKTALAQFESLRKEYESI